jgi:hypothetical protein
VVSDLDKFFVYGADDFKSVFVFMRVRETEIEGCRKTTTEIIEEGGA